MRRTLVAAAMVGVTVSAAGLAAQAQMGQRQDAATGSGHDVSAQDVRATGGARISKERAAEIAKTLMATAKPNHASVSVNVGGLLPGDIDLEPLPSAVIDIVPEYRDFDYVAVNDEIAIVQPSTRKIVEVIDASGESHAMNGSGATKAP
jgi:Protein of unknown function (DUF1236)